MKRFKTVLVLLAFFAALVTPVFAVDTLEVFILRVQFAEEKTDNSLTTGKGTFGTVPDKNYGLDPTKQSGKVPYWEKHLQYADAYYRAASGGKLAIKTTVFPIYTLKKHIIDYNRTSKMEGEKTAEFDEARSRDYLTFVYDAVVAAAIADTSKSSPFRIPLSKNPNVKRAYMIVHAGASRLVDGGSMGTDNADTPGDFMDIYVSRDAWEYLKPDSAKSDFVKPAFGLNDKKDTVVKGLIINGSVLDTLRSIMVVSETASQDGLNWGVNGIVVNQIGRELGLPNTYDVVKGISRLGYFDAMDFAGYNAGNGFLPALPAAWERAYMGWSDVREVRPVAGKPVTVDIAAAGTGKGTEIVKVPLSASEYLLIENRQRSWNKDGKVRFVLGTTDEDADTTVRTVVVDSLSKVFQDSTCNEKGKCTVNKKKAKGLIVGLDSYDAGLPASGIAVWRVNEWYLRETLEYGIANFWGGDTLRDHQFGIAMVEADGILSIGKTFKNALGQDTYDYGSGTDLLPHLRKPAKDSKQKFDTLKTINPEGYANTMTTQGGYTGIKITVNVPKNARKEKTANAFLGDSVVNFAAPVISVTISIDNGSIEGAKFPRNVGLASAVRGAVFVDHPEKDGEKLMVVGAMDGTIQAFDALGDTLFVADTTVVQKRLSQKDTAAEVPLYRVGANFGPLVGMASDGKDVYSLHQKKLVKTTFAGGLPVQQDYDIETATAGPVIVGNEIRFATKKGVTVFKKGDGKIKLEEEREGVTDLVFCGSSDGKDVFAYVTDKGIAYAGEREIKLNGKAGESFRLACTDLDRDGVNEVLAVGSRGGLSGPRGLLQVWTALRHCERSEVAVENRQYLDAIVHDQVHKADLEAPRALARVVHEADLAAVQLVGHVEDARDLAAIRLGGEVDAAGDRAAAGLLVGHGEDQAHGRAGESIAHRPQELEVGAADVVVVAEAAGFEAVGVAAADVGDQRRAHAVDVGGRVVEHRADDEADRVVGADSGAGDVEAVDLRRAVVEDAEVKAEDIPLGMAPGQLDRGCERDRDRGPAHGSFFDFLLLRADGTGDGGNGGREAERTDCLHFLLCPFGGC